jgi:hypothetical protein
VWISVKDQLPEIWQEVLCYYQGSQDIGTGGWKGYGIGFVAVYHNPLRHVWLSNDGLAMPGIATPTHWMSFPEPPIKGEE